jgi:hypothetical protein
MSITCLGIFGFLSKAHVDSELSNTQLNLQIQDINDHIAQTKDTVLRYKTQLAQLDRTIDTLTQKNMISTSIQIKKDQTAERADIKQKLDAADNQLIELNNRLASVKDSVAVLDNQEGSVKYIGELFFANDPDRVAKSSRTMTLLIDSVFDPLAILMLLAANIGFAANKENKKKISDEFVDSEVQPVLVKMDQAKSLFSSIEENISSVEEEVIPKKKRTRKISPKGFSMDTRLLPHHSDGKNWIDTYLLPERDNEGKLNGS